MLYGGFWTRTRTLVGTTNACDWPHVTLENIFLILWVVPVLENHERLSWKAPKAEAPKLPTEVFWGLQRTARAVVDSSRKTAIHDMRQTVCKTTLFCHV